MSEDANVNAEVTDTSAKEVVIEDTKVEEITLTWKEKAEALSAELSILKMEKEASAAAFLALQEDISSYKASAVLGLTDEEGFDIAKMLYQKTSKEVTFKEWLSDGLASQKIKALTPYLSKVESPSIQPVQKQVKIASPSEVSAAPIEAELKALNDRYKMPTTSVEEKRRILEQIKAYRS